MKTQIKRGAYNEILMQTVNPATRKQAENLLKEVTNARKVDEHGAWEFGAAFDSRGRGAAINCDFYAIGRDMHSKRLMVVVQVRKWERRRRNGFADIQKSYFLCGRNEDNTAFAHCVESRVIHAAIRTGKDVVKACQDWMFGCDYGKVKRQGDLDASAYQQMADALYVLLLETKP